MPERDPTLCLRDMLSFCERVLDYTANLGLGDLLSDQMRYDAVLRNLELLGEAASRVPAACRTG